MAGAPGVSIVFNGISTTASLTVSCYDGISKTGGSNIAGFIFTIKMTRDGALT